MHCLIMPVLNVLVALHILIQIVKYIDYFIAKK